MSNTLSLSSVHATVDQVMAELISGLAVKLAKRLADDDIESFHLTIHSMGTHLSLNRVVHNIFSIEAARV